jgi:uncharacterized integral membrane protein
MKNALIVLAIVALVVLTLGLFNREASVDVDYVVGVWRSVSVFWLFAIAGGVVIAAGLLGAALARAQGWRERGKLEKELLEVYRRLRAAETQLEQGAGTVGVPAAAVEAQTTAAEAHTEVSVIPAAADPATAVTQAAQAGEGATAVTAVAETPTVVSEAAEVVTEHRPVGADEAPTVLSEPVEAVTEQHPAGDGRGAAGE